MPKLEKTASVAPTTRRNWGVTMRDPPGASTVGHLTTEAPRLARIRTDQNLEAIKGLHALEGGLLERTSLLDLVADDVEWWAAGSPEVLPWAGIHRGRDAVRRWFETLTEHMDYERFEPLEFYGDRDTVIELVEASGTARATGHAFQSEVVRIWTFDAGKVIRVRSYYDTGVYERAVRP